MTSQLLPCTHLTSLYVCLCADSGTDSRAQTSSDRLPAWTLTRRRSRRCQCSAQRAAASLRACTFSLPAYYASLITIVLAFWLSIASSAVTSLQDVAASQYLVLYCPGCCSVHQIPESFACACAKYACTLHASIELTVSTCLSACSNPHLDNLCSKCNRERQASEATANAIASRPPPPPQRSRPFRSRSRPARRQRQRSRSRARHCRPSSQRRRRRPAAARQPLQKRSNRCRPRCWRR